MGHCDETAGENVHQTPSGHVIQNTVVTITCSGGLTLIGHDRVTCQTGGSWSSTGECEGEWSVGIIGFIGRERDVTLSVIIMSNSCDSELLLIQRN